MKLAKTVTLIIVISLACQVQAQSFAECQKKSLELQLKIGELQSKLARREKVIKKLRENVANKSRNIRQLKSIVNEQKKGLEKSFKQVSTDKDHIDTISEQQPLKGGTNSEQEIKSFYADENFLVIVKSSIIYLQTNSKNARFLNLLTVFYKEGGSVKEQLSGYFKVSGRPQKLKIESSNKKILTINESLNFTIYDFHSTGKVKIYITLADYELEIPIRVNNIPFVEGEVSDIVFNELGWPDSDKKIVVCWPNVDSLDDITYNPSASENCISASHWRYNHYPNAVFVIKNNRIAKISSYHDVNPIAESNIILDWSKKPAVAPGAMPNIMPGMMPGMVPGMMPITRKP